MDIDLKKVLLALLFSTSDPLTIREIYGVYSKYRDELLAQREAGGDDEGVDLEIPNAIELKDVSEALKSLGEELDERRDVYRVMEEPEGFRLAVSPEYSHFVRVLRNDERPLKLSNAAMETLALVAYRQPITRAEMEVIRGVSVDSAVSKLVEHGLIMVNGHANLPGRPRLYITTDEFLKFCGMSSLEDLPVSDIVSPERLTEWMREANKSSGYSDQEMGLPGNDGQIDDASDELHGESTTN